MRSIEAEQAVRNEIKQTRGIGTRDEAGAVSLLWEYAGIVSVWFPGATEGGYKNLITHVIALQRNHFEFDKNSSCRLSTSLPVPGPVPHWHRC